MYSGVPEEGEIVLNDFVNKLSPEPPPPVDAKGKPIPAPKAPKQGGKGQPAVVVPPKPARGYGISQLQDLTKFIKKRIGFSNLEMLSLFHLALFDNTRPSARALYKRILIAGSDDPTKARPHCALTQCLAVLTALACGVGGRGGGRKARVWCVIQSCAARIFHTGPLSFQGESRLRSLSNRDAFTLRRLESVFCVCVCARPRRAGREAASDAAQSFQERQRPPYFIPLKPHPIH
jgi:hypothetical protein